jgi:D,D-heptose 1,7-bisphosphate phosphatase
VSAARAFYSKIPNRGQCVILVGGRGTRLGALTQQRPKPLLDVAGRPFVSYLIQEAARHGFTRILLLAGFKSDAFAAEIAALKPKIPIDVEITLLTEPEPRGTAGALKFARPHLDEQFLMLNGDSLFDINLLDLTRPLGDALGRLALKPQPDVSRYGKVDLAGTLIRRFVEKDQSAGAGVINGGVYWLSRKVVDLIPDGMVSIETDVFPKLVAAGKLKGVVYDRFMLDIGLPDTLAEAQTVIPAQLRRPAVFLDRDGVLNDDVGYAHRPDQITWTRGALAAVKALNDAGCYVFVITNQAGVARGYYPLAQVDVLHGWMAGEMAAHGAHIDAYAYCPFHEEGVVAEFKRASDRRKPAPGMVLDLLEDWPILKDASFLVGDKALDLDTAKAAGIASHHFTGGDLEAFVKSRISRG